MPAGGFRIIRKDRESDAPDRNNRLGTLRKQAIRIGDLARQIIFVDRLAQAEQVIGLDTKELDVRCGARYQRPDLGGRCRGEGATLIL